LEPDSRPSEELAVEGIDLQSQLSVLMPVPLPAGSVVDPERTEQTSVFIPLPAQAMQFAAVVTPLLRQLAVEMPHSDESVELAVHLPVFQANLPVPVIKPVYAAFWHVKRSIVFTIRVPF
jgi:hypothetical protein